MRIRSWASEHISKIIVGFENDLWVADRCSPILLKLAKPLLPCGYVMLLLVCSEKPTFDASPSEVNL